MCRYSQYYSPDSHLTSNKVTLLDKIYEFFEDETVLGQTVEVDVVEPLDLADLEVIGSLSHQQDSKLIIVEFSQTTLHLVG